MNEEDRKFIRACRERADKRFNEDDWHRLRDLVGDLMKPVWGCPIPFVRADVGEEHFIAWNRPCVLDFEAISVKEASD